MLRYSNFFINIKVIDLAFLIVSANTHIYDSDEYLEWIDWGDNADHIRSALDVLAFSDLLCYRGFTLSCYS